MNDITFDDIKKTRKDRKPTVCSDKRRQHNCCGVCGSENTAEQGVIYCTNCGAEAEYLTETDVFFWHYNRYTSVPEPCTCKKPVRIIRNRAYQSNYLETIYVKKCLDCGAVMSNFCPNCKKKNRLYGCWKSWDGRYFCQSCGFRK